MSIARDLASLVVAYCADDGERVQAFSTTRDL